MFATAFLVTLHRLAPALVANLVAFNVPFVFRTVEIASFWWLVPLEFVALLLLVLVLTPIEYFKLSSYSKE